MTSEEPEQGPSKLKQGVENVQLHVPFPTSFVYSNASSFSLSAMEMKIGFGEAMPDRLVEPRVGVSLPIEHAAYLAVTLFNQLNTFEQHFGQIREPNWRAMKEIFLQGASSIVANSPETPTEGDKEPIASPEAEGV